MDGRLHVHICIYGSKHTPALITPVACSPELRTKGAESLESVCCTKFDATVHAWRSECLDNGRMQRAFEVPVPSVNADFEVFISAAQKRASVTISHSHPSTCLKGSRGKYMCRLSQPAGIYSDCTGPIIIKSEQHGNVKEVIKPLVTGLPLPYDVCKLIDNKYSAAEGELFRRHSAGPILWELNRPSIDGIVVETNLALAAFTASHSNSAIIDGQDAADMIDEYQNSYMTKTNAGLKGAASALLSSLGHIKEYPTKAEDSQSELRTGKHLAARTINSFSGADEWSHALKVHAITSHRSFISSDIFRFVFLYVLMEFFEHVDTKTYESVLTEGDLHGCETNEDKVYDQVEDAIEELIHVANESDNGKVSDTNHNHGCGARTFYINGKVIFVTQAETYFHRGECFKDYTPIEFECIVDILPVKDNVDEQNKKKRGRPQREGFPFASTYPLFGRYLGYILMKMNTAVLGGAPPPKCVRMILIKKKSKALAKYLLCAFTPWASGKIQWSYDTDGLIKLCHEWDSAHASLVNRQRCRHLRNIMKKGYRCSSNEQLTTDWRNRNVDYWKDFVSSEQNSCRRCQVDDTEFLGLLKPEVDTYDLLKESHMEMSLGRWSLKYCVIYSVVL